MISLISQFFVASCGVSSDPILTPGSSATIPATSTVPPTSISLTTDTPTPPPAQPTVAPAEGITSTQLNVRAEPSTGSSVLGIIPANTKVEITGKDPAGNWWQILYPQGPDGMGWVTAQYVTTANGNAVPVIGGGVDPNGENAAIVQQQINVRSGPGTSFNSLGTLNAKDVVRLTGRDTGSAWLQIEFQSGPEGKGWVNAAFVQARAVENLPIVAETGELIGTATPTGIPPTPVATVVPAWMDNDSLDHPLASVVFDPLGTRTMIYRGDVSAPEGDPTDWIQFQPYGKTIFAGLECTGGDDLQVKVLENGQPSSLELACGESRRQWDVTAGSVYMIQLQAPQSSGGLQKIAYTVRIQASQ